jgi:uncharacterized membrane protein YebE (DUF533 family)
MFDANKMLGMLMESGLAPSGRSRVQRLAGSQGGGGLADIAGALLGGGGNRAGGGGIADIAGALLGGGGNRGSGAGGIADIAGALLGGSRNSAATSGGAMGMLGTLAAVAMQQFGSAQGSSEPGLAEEAAAYRTDDAAADPQSRATVMIRAMIDAAKADGEIDPQERQRILGRLDDAGADPDARAFVADAMAGPGDLNAIIAAVDSPHTAVEVYAASLFAIDVDTPAEAAYMRRLATGLGLDPVLVRALHQSLEPPA